MPPKGRWILIVAALASVAIALDGVITYPLDARDWTMILLYEIAMFVGIGIILGLTYKRGYTAPDVPT